MPELPYKYKCTKHGHKVDLAMGPSDYRKVTGRSQTCPDCGGPMKLVGKTGHATESIKKCRVCGKKMNPVDALVGGAGKDKKGPICRKCTDKARKRVMRENIGLKLWTPSGPKEKPDKKKSDSDALDMWASVLAGKDPDDVITAKKEPS